MPKTDTRQGSITEIALNEFLGFWVESFLFDRKSQNMADGTLTYYQVKLKTFLGYCESQQITQIGQLTPNDLRKFFAWLEETGHNAGGRHALYRAVKTFLLWYENEAEPEDWKNPIRKVKAPKVPTEPLDPVPMEDVKAMEATCQKNFMGSRDKAMLLCLIDTGARATEFLDLDLEDIDLISGAVLIRSGKGRKPRTVYLGAKSKRAFRTYLKYRQDECSAAWISTEEPTRLTYSGLKWMIIRRAERAHVKAYGLHAFRRQFAITMLRKGVDLATLARLMGHANLVVLMRYLKQLPIDLQNAHRKAAPVDSADL